MINNTNYNVDPKLLKSCISELHSISEELKGIKDMLSALVKVENSNKNVLSEGNEDTHPNTSHHIRIAELANMGELSRHSSNALLRAGFHILDDLCYVSMSDLRKVRSIGGKSLQELCSFADAYSLEIGSKIVTRYQEGEIVCSTVNRELPEKKFISVGDILKVVGTYDPHYSCFNLPNFEVEAEGNTKFYVSPGEVEQLGWM